MLGLQVVLLIVDVEAATLPLIGLGLTILLERVHEGLHPVRVRAVILLQIHDVELVGQPYITLATYTAYLS